MEVILTISLILSALTVIFLSIGAAESDDNLTIFRITLAVTVMILVIIAGFEYESYKQEIFQDAAKAVYNDKTVLVTEGYYNKDSIFIPTDSIVVLKSEIKTRKIKQHER